MFSFEHIFNVVLVSSTLELASRIENCVSCFIQNYFINFVYVMYLVDFENA